MSARTPGPWRVEPSAHGKTYRVVGPRGDILETMLGKAEAERVAWQENARHEISRLTRERDEAVAQRDALAEQAEYHRTLNQARAALAEVGK